MKEWAIKNKNWQIFFHQYSSKTETLYARHMKKVSTVVVVEGELPSGCSLLLTPRYTKHLSPLSNCPHHAKNGHFIRIDESLNNYHSFNVTYGLHSESLLQYTSLDLNLGGVGLLLWWCWLVVVVLVGCCGVGCWLVVVVVVNWCVCGWWWMVGWYVRLVVL